jgi:hypothetical protein
MEFVRWNDTITHNVLRMRYDVFALMKVISVMSVCTIVINRELLDGFSWLFLWTLCHLRPVKNRTNNFLFGNTNVTVGEVVEWDSYYAITHNRLSVRDEVVAPEDVIGLDELIFSLRWKACASNVEQGTPLELVCTPKRAPFQSCYVWMWGPQKGFFFSIWEGLVTPSAREPCVIQSWLCLLTLTTNLI